MESPKGFKRILLATDGSVESAAAVDVTLALAKASSAEVLVVHVWNLEVHHRHGYWDVEVRSEAEQLVDATADRFRTEGIRVAREIRRADHGHVASAVAQSARDFCADLVVVGSRGLSDLHAMIESSVSRQVLCEVDCPVLIVRRKGAGTVERVLLAIAGGDDLKVGVRAAAAAAAAPGSSVLVVHVVQSIVGAHGIAYVEPDQEARATIAEAVRQLKEAGVAADGVVAHPGPVAQSVAERAESWDADLIVVGSSRMRDLSAMVIGSVSRHLLRSTGRPVLVAERVV
jgi:nucleotide-binding universal stress UspA family protein